MKKNNILMICLLILTFIIVVVGSSFAFYTFYQVGSEENIIKTGGLNMVFDDSSSSLSLSNDNAYPVTDDTGRNTSPYTFTLTSINSIDVRYEISIVNDQNAILNDGCGDNLIDYSNIKVQLIKNGVVVTEGLLSDYSNTIIESSIIGSDDVFSYELRLWIDSEATSEIMGKHFHGKVQLKVMDLVNTSQ